DIVFNLSPTAVRDLKMLNDLIEFKASFSGVIHIVSAPIKAILAIYAEENGEGIFFDADEEADNADSDTGEVVTLKGIDGSTGIDSLDRQNMSDVAETKPKPFLKLVE